MSVYSLTTSPGLGGTSLMNANVFLEANHDALGMKAWPREIREDPGCLDKCENARSTLVPEWQQADLVSQIMKRPERYSNLSHIHKTGPNCPNSNYSKNKPNIWARVSSAAPTRRPASRTDPTVAALR